MHGPNSGIALARCISFVRQAHGNQVDLSGQPYWLRSVAVMTDLFDNYGGQVPPNVLKAALLHKVLEDTSFTATDLLELGYSSETVQLVAGVTKHADTDYETYIKAIRDANSKWPVAIKVADLRRSLDPQYLANVPEAQRPLISSWDWALRCLTSKEGE